MRLFSSKHLVSGLAMGLAMHGWSHMILKRNYTDPPGYVFEPPPVSSLPKPNAGNASANSNGKFQWQYWGKCSDENKTMITQAWEDAKIFVDAFAAWKPKADYQSAVDMYMGSRSTYENFRGYNFPKQIQDTIARYRGLYEGKSTYGNAALWVYCNEDSYWFKQCGLDVEAVIAYETEDRWFNNWYITLCPKFFNPEQTLPLHDWLDQISRYDKTVMEALRLCPVSRPFIFFHESFHMSQLVTSPKADDYVYGAKDDYDLARTRDTDATVYNADSWSITGLAIWAQQEYNLPNPPIPQKYHPKNPDNGFQSLNDTSSPVLDVIYVDTQNVVPQGAWPVPQGSPYFVDTNLWEIYTPSSTVSTSTSTSSSSTAASSFTSTSTSAVATCSGNQVEGDCTAGIYPSVAPYSGDQAPVCDKADGGNTQPRLNSASASAAAATYCSELIASSTILTATDSPPKPGLIGNGAAENNGMLAVSVMFNVASCPQDQSNSTLDFAQLGQTECEMDLFGTVDQMCEQDSQWEGYNQDFTLEGGIYLADCGLWSLTGQAG